MLPPKSLIGMVHIPATPGTPHSRHGVAEIVAHAIADARVLHDAGFDGVIVENMHDRPYINGPHDPVLTSTMTRAVDAVVREVGTTLKVGVQILSRGEREALAVAHTCGAHFIRCENFVFSHVADEGLMMDAAAGSLLRYRKSIGAESIKIFADVQKKHASHAITGDLSVADWAHAAEFFCADGLIVTGQSTGMATDVSDVLMAKKAGKLPVFVGSGVTPSQVESLFASADGLIVGSYIKEGGKWDGAIDLQRCREIVKARK